MWFGVGCGPAAGGAGGTAARGVAKLLFMRESRDVTSAYEDWSFSSSSENGLNDVRLVTSSATLVLLRDLPGTTLWVLCTGERNSGDSIVANELTCKITLCRTFGSPQVASYGWPLR